MDLVFTLNVKFSDAMEAAAAMVPQTLAEMHERLNAIQTRLQALEQLPALLERVAVALEAGGDKERIAALTAQLAAERARLAETQTEGGSR